MVKFRKTVFLDRDGTINREVRYLRKMNDFHLLPGTLEALKILNNDGWQLICVTNQSGVARGLLDETFLNELHTQIIKDFAGHGIDLAAIYYCPHHPEAIIPQYRKTCNCRKPQPGLLEKAVREHNVDITQSIVVGDKLSDILTGKNMGIRNAMVMTGYGKEELERGREQNILPDFYFEDLFAFSKWLIRNEDQIRTPSSSNS